MSSATTRREQVQAALKTFADTSVHKAATNLINALGYASEKIVDIGSSAATLLVNIERFKPELGKISCGDCQASYRHRRAVRAEECGQSLCRAWWQTQRYWQTGEIRR